MYTTFRRIMGANYSQKVRFVRIVAANKRLPDMEISSDFAASLLRVVNSTELIFSSEGNTNVGIERDCFPFNVSGVYRRQDENEDDTACAERREVNKTDKNLY